MKSQLHSERLTEIECVTLSKVPGALGKFGHVEKADDQMKNISQTLNPKCKPAVRGHSFSPTPPLSIPPSPLLLSIAPTYIIPQ